MIPFITPKYLKQAKLYIKEAEKRISYNRDLWNCETIGAFRGVVEKLKAGIKGRSRESVAIAEKELETLCNQHCPLGKDAMISENVEVFLVAIVIALGIRTYFLQPFTIPTSSMFPTLNGITGQMTKEEPPNVLTQALEFAAKGRSYVNVIAKDDEFITRVVDEKWRIFNYTRLDTNRGNIYWIHENSGAVKNVFFPHAAFSPNGQTEIPLKKGEPVARGYFDTGDHVFVDKCSYHFRKPTRGEVFVFSTADIPLLKPQPGQFTQYYIKRLAGIPRDQLRIQAPELFINGQRAQEPEFIRVMDGKPAEDPRFPTGYQGYSHNVGTRMRDSQDLVEVPEQAYYALGDNSYNSSDGRAWGFVPGRNLMGTGILVYWPFLRDGGTHFGVIK